MIGANMGVSMPVFWLGLMLIYVFALLLKDTPFQASVRCRSMMSMAGN